MKYIHLFLFYPTNSFLNQLLLGYPPRHFKTLLAHLIYFTKITKNQCLSDLPRHSAQNPSKIEFFRIEFKLKTFIVHILNKILLS